MIVSTERIVQIRSTKRVRPTRAAATLWTLSRTHAVSLCLTQKGDTRVSRFSRSLRSQCLHGSLVINIIQQEATTPANVCILHYLLADLQSDLCSKPEQCRCPSPICGRIKNTQMLMWCWLSRSTMTVRQTSCTRSTSCSSCLGFQATVCSFQTAL